MRRTAPPAVHSRLPQVVIALAALLSLWPLCAAEFTSWDDPQTVYQNPTLNPPTLHSIRVWWTSANLDLWDPITDMMRGALALVGTTQAPDPLTGSKLNPYVYHSANLLIHIIAALIVFQVLQLLLSQLAQHSERNGLQRAPQTEKQIQWAACAGAVLFAVHPVQVESVGWVTAMKDLLCGLFSVAAIWRYLIYDGGTGVSLVHKPGEHGRDARATREFSLSTFLFVLAILSKPTAVVVPLIVLAINWLILQRPLRKIWRGMFLWILLSLPCIVVTKLVQPGVIAERVAFWKRPLIATDALAFYLYKLIWPVRLGLDYGRSPRWVFKHGYAWWTWTIPIGIAVVLFLCRKRLAMVAAGGAIFVLGLMPVLGVVPFDFQRYSTVSDHYLYLSMFGVALAGAWATARIQQRWHRSFVAASLAALAVCAWFQTQAWKSNASLYQHALIVNPESDLAATNMAAVYVAENQPDKAIPFALDSIRINDHSATAYGVLGDAFLAARRIPEAAAAYRNACRLDSTDASAALHLGRVLAIEGRTGEATAWMWRARDLDSSSATAHRGLAVLLAMQSDWARAFPEFRRALQLAPFDAELHARFAAALADAGNSDEARRECRAALQIDPHNEPARALLGRLDRLQPDRAGSVRPSRQLVPQMQSPP